MSILTTCDTMLSHILTNGSGTLVLIALSSLLLAVLILERIQWWTHPIHKSNIPIAPHTIPFLGNLPSFRSNFVTFISSWSKHFQSDVFATYMGGKVAIFITDPFAASYVTSGRNPQLKWPAGAQIMKQAMGISDGAVRELTQTREGHKIYDKHLMNAENLDDLLAKYGMVLERKIFSSLIQSGTEKNGWVELGIQQLFGGAIFMSSAEVLFGDPNLATEYHFDLAMTFTKYMTKFMSNPKCMNSTLFRDAYTSREKLVARMKSILPQVSSSDDSSQVNSMHYFSDLAKDLDTFHLKYSEASSLENRARTLFLSLFASIINTVPTIFWVVYHLLADETAYKTIRNEIHSIYKEKQQSGKDKDKGTSERKFTLSDLERMENLDSLLKETMRLRSTTRILRSRIATKDFEMKLPLHGKTKQLYIKKDTMLFTCPTIMHHDDEIFENAETFQWDRFLSQNGKDPNFTKNGQTIRNPVDAFGGGPTLCPGRRFAKAEIKLIVASLLVDYDVRFVGGKVPDPPEISSLSWFRNGIPANDVPIEVRRCNLESSISL